MNRPIVDAVALGKRYAQDNPLDWGIAADKKSEDLTQCAPESTTLKAKREAASLARHPTAKPSKSDPGEN